MGTLHLGTAIMLLAVVALIYLRQTKRQDDPLYPIVSRIVKGARLGALVGLLAVVLMIGAAYLNYLISN